MKKILIVDDEKKIVEVVRGYLEKEGYVVYEAYDGKEALEAFHNNSLDLIVLDLMLPGISGEEVCKVIRNESNIPIIMVSAKCDEESLLNGFNIGADDYIKKPFSPKELVARVATQLRIIDEINPQLLIKT